MKTISHLIRSAMVNYHGMHEQNDIRIATEYGTDEYDEAGKRREYYREGLEEAINDLKALGIAPDMLI